MTDTHATLTARQNIALRSYETSPNYGRGRLVGITRELHRMGLITRAWSGPKDWVLTLSAQGRRALASTSRPDPLN